MTFELSFAFIFLLVSSSAQTLSLDETIERALNRHPDLITEQAQLARAAADSRVARSKRFPSIEATAILGGAPGARVGSVPNGTAPQLAPLFSTDKQTELLDDLGIFARVDVQLRQPIYTFDKITLGLEAARVGEEARALSFEAARRRVIVEAKKIYWGYQLTTKLRDAIASTVQQLEDAIDQAEARILEDSGTVTQADVLKLKLSTKRIQKEAYRLRREQTAALLGFRRAVGAPISATVRPVDGPLEPLVKDAEALLATTPELDAPEIAAAQAGTRAQEIRLKIESRKSLPDVFLGGLFRYAVAPSRDDIVNPFLFDRFNFIEGGVFLGIRGNIDIAGRNAAIEKQEAEIRWVASKQEQAAIGIPVAFARALSKVEETLATYKLMQRARKEGRGLAFSTVSNFRLGTGSARDILEALGLYSRAQTDLYRAVFDLNVAVAECARYASIIPN